MTLMNFVGGFGARAMPSASNAGQMHGQSRCGSQLIDGLFWPASCLITVAVAPTERAIYGYRADLDLPTTREP